MSLCIVWAAAHATATAHATAAWQSPVDPPWTIVRGFVAPAGPYSAAHRGIDLAASVGLPVVAPAGGVVSFSGYVVDRPVVSITAFDGTILSMEPVKATVAEGARVSAGTRLGVVATGGHCDGRCLHVGVRRDGGYLSPLLFLADVPPAVLLPLR